MAAVHYPDDEPANPPARLVALSQHSHDSDGCDYDSDDLKDHTTGRDYFNRVGANGSRTKDPAGDESSTVAGLADQKSRVESGNLVRLLQGPHWDEIGPARRHGARGALLWMDRQSRQTARRRAIRRQGDAAEADEQVVGHQSETVGRAEDSRAAHVRWTHRCAND